MQGALFVAIIAGTDLARDIESGFFNRLALTPLRGGALLAGQLGGSIVVAVLQSIVYLLVGIATRRRDRERRWRRVRAARAVDPDLVRLRRLGALLALRFGTGEAVQGVLPAAVRDRVPQLIEPAAEPDQGALVPDVATYNPVSYLIEGVRSLVITGWDARRRSRSASASPCAVGPQPRLRRRGDEEQAGADVRRFVLVASGVAWRSVHNTRRQPGDPVAIDHLPAVLPRRVRRRPLDDRRRPELRLPARLHRFPVRLRVPAVGGVRRSVHGFAVARDFDSGFARRLLLSAPRRSGIIAGYVVGALVRWLVTGVVTIAALIAGMHVSGDGVDLVGLLGLGILVNLAAALWACGVAMFLRTEQAGPLIQMPVFVILFLAPVYVPLSC